MVANTAARNDGATQTTQKSTKKATTLGILAALGGLIFGLDTSVSGALPFIAADFHASNALQGWIVSSMMAGAAFGSLIAGRISMRFGRTGAMLGSAVLFVVGIALSTFAPSPVVLIIGRLFLGFAVGIAAFATPLYISEITEESARGSMVSLYQLMISLGIVLAFVSDSLLSTGGHWRWMLGIMVVPASVFLGITLILPQSPRWLMMKGDHERARKVLQDLRSSEAAAEVEFQGIQSRVQQSDHAGFSLFRRNPNFRRSVALGMLLQVMQQLTGINALLYYAPRVFQAAHFGTKGAIWATTLIGLTNLAFTSIAIVFVDRWGRRPLLILSSAIAAFALLGVGVLLSIGAPGLTAQLILCGLVLLFVAGFAIGEGPLVWTLCSEVQPTRGRDFGIGCSTVTNWTANWAISNTFPLLMVAMGASSTFLLFAACNGLFILVTFFMVPETKGVSLETIEANLFARKRLRHLGR